jgi:MFS family permease
VVASVANFTAFGALFSFGVFLSPLAEEFGTTTGPVAPLFSGAVCCYYTAGAVGGRVADRHGVRPVLLAGAGCLGLGLLLTARAAALWQVYVAYVPLFGVGVGCCYAPLIGAVSRWFDRQRSMAVGLLLAGVGAGTLVVPVAAQALVDTVGWRTTLVVLALAAVVAVGAAAAVASEAPSDGSAGPLGLSELTRSAEFRRLYLSVILVGPGFWAPFAFYNDYAVGEGIRATAAAGLVGVAGASSVAGRLLSGSVGARLGGMRLYRVGFVTMTAALAVWLVAGGSYELLVVSAVLLGLGWAAWVVATPSVLVEWYGVRDLGGVLGAFYTGLGIGALAGPAVSGFVIDAAGYRTAILVVLVLDVTACVVVPRPRAAT